MEGLLVGWLSVCGLYANPMSMLSQRYSVSESGACHQPTFEELLPGNSGVHRAPTQALKNISATTCMAWMDKCYCPPTLQDLALYHFMSKGTGFQGEPWSPRKAVNAGAGAVNQKEGGWFPCCWVLGGLSSRGEKRWSGSWGPAELNLIWDWGRSWAQHSTTRRTTVPRNDFQTPGVGKAQTLPIHWKTRNEPTKRNCSFWSQYLLNWRKRVLLLRKSRIVSVLSLKLVVLEPLVVPSRPSSNELRQTLDVSSSQGGSITWISCRGAFWASRTNSWADPASGASLHAPAHPLFLFRAWVLSHSVMSSSFQLHGLKPTRLLCPWDSPNTELGWHFLCQGIFPTQGSNLSLLCCLHWQTGSLPLAPLGSPSKWLSILSAHFQLDGMGNYTPNGSFSKSDQGISATFVDLQKEQTVQKDHLPFSAPKTSNSTGRSDIAQSLKADNSVCIPF